MRERNESFRFIERREGGLPERMNYYLFVDTALKKKKGSDYTVMMVIGFGSDGRKYVIDFICDKMKLSEKTEAILELAEKWRPLVIFGEENASVEGGEHIAEVFEKRGWPIAPRREAGCIEGRR